MYSIVVDTLVYVHAFLWDKSLKWLPYLDYFFCLSDTSDMLGPSNDSTLRAATTLCCTSDFQYISRLYLKKNICKNAKTFLKYVGSYYFCSTNYGCRGKNVFKIVHKFVLQMHNKENNCSYVTIQNHLALAEESLVVFVFRQISTVLHFFPLKNSTM